jgi:hypothetical protein
MAAGGEVVLATLTLPSPRRERGFFFSFFSFPLSLWESIFSVPLSLWEREG